MDQNSLLWTFLSYLNVEGWGWFVSIFLLFLNFETSKRPSNQRTHMTSHWERERETIQRHIQETFKNPSVQRNFKIIFCFSFLSRVCVVYFSFLVFISFDIFLIIFIDKLPCLSIHLSIYLTSYWFSFWCVVSCVSVGRLVGQKVKGKRLSDWSVFQVFKLFSFDVRCYCRRNYRKWEEEKNLE